MCLLHVGAEMQQLLKKKKKKMGGKRDNEKTHEQLRADDGEEGGADTEDLPGQEVREGTGKMMAWSRGLQNGGRSPTFP